MAQGTMAPQRASTWMDDRLIERLAMMATLAWLVIWCFWSWGYWEDDSYIHLAYARSVSQGQGFVFNGALSNGDTAPLWVLALSLAGSLAPDWILGGKVLSLLCVVVALWSFALFCKKLLPAEMPGSGTSAALLLALIFASPFTLHWAYSGMEALMASAWVVLMSMNLAAERPSWRQTLLACLLLGMSPLLRPEFVLMAPVALPFLWRHTQVLRQNNSPVQAAVKCLICVLLLLGPLLLWSAYALQAFGYIMPNTNAAKRAAPGVIVPWRLLQLTGMGFPMLLLACIGLGWTAMRPRRSTATLVPRLAWPLLAWCGLVLAFYVVNHTHVQTRYLLVLGPGLLVVAWSALIRRWGAARITPWLLLGILGTSTISLLLLKPLANNKIAHDQRIEELASLIRQKVPPQDPIAVYSIGQIGFLLPNPIVDTGGITQPSATPYLFGPTSDMVAWARRQGARYYISGDKPEPDAVLVHHMSVPVGGWFLQPSAYAGTEDINLWLLSAR